MIPKKDKTGFVSVSLTATEEKKLRAAWPILEQLGYFTRSGCSYNGVQGASIAIAAVTIARLIGDETQATTGTS